MIESLHVTWRNHERAFGPVFEFIFHAFYALWAKVILTSVFDLCAPELITNPFEEEEQRKEREKESWNLEEEKQLCSAWVWIGGFTTAFYSRIATNQCCKKKNVKKKQTLWPLDFKSLYEKFARNIVLSKLCPSCKRREFLTPRQARPNQELSTIIFPFAVY